MKNRFKITPGLINIALILTIVLLFNLSLNYLQPFYDILVFLATPMILTLYVFYAFRPIRNFVYKFTGHRIIASLVAFIAFLAIVFLLFTLTFDMIYQQVQSFLTNLDFEQIQASIGSQAFNDFLQEANNYLPLESLLDRFKSSSQDMVQNLPSTLGALIGNMGNYFSIIMLVLFGFFYLLIDEDRFHHTLKKMSVGPYYDELTHMGQEIHQVLKSFISGQILVAAILGTFVFIGYRIIDLPYTLSLAMIAALMNFIPFLGPYLGAAPAVLVALTLGPSQVLKVVIISILAQQAEGNVITPHIMGNRLEIHPFMVIVSVMVSLKLFGVLGALIACPLYMILKITFKGLVKIYRKHFGESYYSDAWKEAFIKKKDQEKDALDPEASSQEEDPQAKEDK
ncbi:MAG: AI-2E family transporter [Tissierellia bacterium]|nr:AI-2E family transporter [Tissierellia bacterium]